MLYESNEIQIEENSGFAQGSLPKVTGITWKSLKSYWKEDHWTEWSSETMSVATHISVCLWALVSKLMNSILGLWMSVRQTMSIQIFRWSAPNVFWTGVGATIERDTAVVRWAMAEYSALNLRTQPMCSLIIKCAHRRNVSLSVSGSSSPERTQLSS